MDEGKFLAACAVAVVALLVGIPAGCTISGQRATVEAIKAGADPLEAKCALQNDSRDPVCILVGSRPRLAQP